MQSPLSMKSSFKTIRRCAKLFMFCLVVSYVLCAQTVNPPPVSTAFAVLVKGVESKSAIPGQEFTLRTIGDVLVEGKVVIPKGSRVVGHVTEVVAKGNGSQQSILGVIIDKAITEAGREIPLQAIIAAVGPRQDDSLASDPTYGMMHSNEPKMIGSGPRGASNVELPSSSKVTSTAAVATARMKGGLDDGLVLNTDSQGVVGLTDLSLSWRLNAPPPVTVFSSSGKNIKLEAGTQTLLRMATPQISR
jgi:hypothetical protein